MDCVASGMDRGDAPEMDINCRCCMLQRAVWALDEAELETLKERAEYFGLDKAETFEEFKGKYLTVTQNDSIMQMVTAGSGVRRVARDLAKQEAKSLKKGIKSYEKRIAEHEKKIANPADYDAGWDFKSEIQKNGLLEHWKKEIEEFQKSIQDRKDLLRERGDLDD